MRAGLCQCILHRLVKPVPVARLVQSPPLGEGRTADRVVAGIEGSLLHRRQPVQAVVAVQLIQARPVRALARRDGGCDCSSGRNRT